MPGPEDQPRPPGHPKPEDLRRAELELQDRLGRLDEKIHKSKEKDLEEAELYRLRFLRAHEIVAWLTEEFGHFMEPPAVELYFDGSGKFSVGEKTMGELCDSGRETLERLVGSSRWETERRMGGPLRYVLTVCHLNLEEEFPR